MFSEDGYVEQVGRLEISSDHACLSIPSLFSLLKNFKFHISILLFVR